MAHKAYKDNDANDGGETGWAIEVDEFQDEIHRDVFLEVREYGDGFKSIAVLDIPPDRLRALATWILENIDEEN
jgi:hypothetical protein